MKYKIKLHAPEHDWRYEAEAIKAERQDSITNPNLSDYEIWKKLCICTHWQYEYRNPNCPYHNPKQPKISNTTERTPMNTTTRAQRINKRYDAIWDQYQQPREDKLVLKDSTKTKLACFQLVNERTGVVYADIYSDGLADMIADHNYKVTS